MDRTVVSPPRRSRRRRLRRVLLARRRPLAALAAGLAVLVGLQAAAAPPPALTPVVTAARDLPAGSVLTEHDLTLTSFAPGSVPDGAVTAAAATGRTTTGPVRRGEPLTDARLLHGSLLDGYPGTVAAPVRIADPGTVSLLRVGDRVDVVAADPQGRREAELVAAGAPVVALPRSEESMLASGGLVVLAVTETTARGLADAAVSGYLSIILTH
jgi:Flp pilus assembly protein CpaB